MQYQNDFLTSLESRIAPIRQQIVQHPLYDAIDELNDIHHFVEHHVYAVWDFMSLLKALQNKLTCTHVPWTPVQDTETCFLINEIVVGEESDELPDGTHISHFELYLKAMTQLGANTRKINELLTYLKAGLPFPEAAGFAKLPEAAIKFMNFTFKIINSGKTHQIAAIFTFGREDLIPDMFHSLVKDLNQKFPNQLSLFKYYLDRHIEIDGDHHSELALQMTNLLCDNDPEKWAEVEEVVVQALEMRLLLWNAALKEIRESCYA